MAKKEKLAIQKDKRMEPIDNELDAAMGLLDTANRQITDLLTSFVPVTPSAEEGVEEKPEVEVKDSQPEAGDADPAAKSE
jgi:hypothetical protein